ncbi:2-keto-4-pentenoate hydratase/2-oxohepta-3-ene-1,7-dioic acid hydratase in catechol pathway [Anaerosolibacter carboniphilus]|uniref:2-keto-4-pentenoate hydratase/2-oxohepta-3-ene-1,7-dioic acid hydratase in catechol pathway n=1 Tax=Anaerosolibacter carboniphilus TaxID=1417629 RepID=A0A841KUT3_9FIRM|nr:fumarylacetoacetate hydrolase family protein [Anaerosolibacter carboniphilus]MBB6217211.1 2-keto-4-pentenoate hydratase/2-oxohepta-3-ene-1,7-dioic acid hydratase in catechol pathway [Anaerosolibacter carboniphilus]
MYFVTYEVGKEEKVGLCDPQQGKIISIDRFFEKEEITSYPKTMLELIDIFTVELGKKMEGWAGQEAFLNEGIACSEVKIKAPIPYPRRNIFCLGKNYLDHAKEVGTVLGDQEEIPKAPIYFSKVAAPAIADGDFIDSHPGIAQKLDYEVELAVVIGKEGKNIPVEAAEEYIFGYTILNDVSERGLQKLHGQWHKGKSLDTFCPMGPYLVHKSQIPFPVELEIACHVNGELRQHSNTRNLIFDIPQIIHDLSKGMTLKPGDIIATGTPAGVGMGFKPFKFLNPGDVVTCSIEKLGTLTNQVK